MHDSEKAMNTALTFWAGSIVNLEARLICPATCYTCLLNSTVHDVIKCLKLPPLLRTHCNEYGTTYAISSDFGDRMTTQHLD